jgi:hypothetical protein
MWYCVECLKDDIQYPDIEVIGWFCGECDAKARKRWLDNPPPPEPDEDDLQAEIDRLRLLVVAAAPLKRAVHAYTTNSGGGGWVRLVQALNTYQVALENYSSDAAPCLALVWDEVMHTQADNREQLDNARPEADRD